MTDVNTTITAKKSYSKPQVTVVNLVAGEAVLADCKMAGGESTCQTINCVPGFTESS